MLKLQNSVVYTQFLTKNYNIKYALFERLNTRMARHVRVNGPDHQTELL
jgi:hypothetical protein